MNIRRLNINFTNSPYERMMKEVPHYEKPAPKKAPQGLVQGVLIGGGSSVFSAIDSTAKSWADVLHLARKEAQLARLSGHSFGGGNMISLPALNFSEYC